jgi:membrane associated rhomboid family serine protease
MRAMRGPIGSVTQKLIWINVVVFLIQLGCGASRWDGFEWFFALHGTGVRLGFLWQPLTYMFLHGGIWHLLINLFVLWFFGREVELFLGPRRFAWLYFGGGIAGAALWLAFNFYSSSPVVGASAAVLACVIAFATMFPDREITLLVFFVLPVTMKAKYLALIAIAFDAVPLLERANTNVAHLAHLGGAALGWLFVKALGYGRPWQIRWPRWPKRATRSRDDFLRDEIDPILDKISREGMQSLTARERKILESARDLLQK